MQEVLDTIPCRVSDDMNHMLMAPYTAKEVKDALFQMFPTKAPGLDDFLAHFFQQNWDICGDEVVRAVLPIVKGEESAEVINNTVLVLIPKVQIRCNFHSSVLLAFAMCYIKLIPRIFLIG
jgi:hypothetical protein